MNSPTELLGRDAVKNAVNPHLLTLLKIDSEHEAEWVSPRSLVNFARFDVMAKTHYVRLVSLGRSSDWPVHLYREHLRVWGGFKEGDGSGKNDFETYLSGFKSLVESMRNSGFDVSRGLVPVGRGDVIIDGAHRLGAALALDRKIRVVRFNVAPTVYDFAYLRRLGLPGYCSDVMAMEFVRRIKDLRILVVFPVARGHEDKVDSLLQDCGDIFYKKDVHFSRCGRGNLIRLLYQGEEWLGGGARESPGLRHHIESRFSTTRPVKFVFLDCSHPEKLRQVKECIRDIYGIGNDSVHINDQHEQGIELAEAILNDNGVHFLNHSQFSSFDKFNDLLERFKVLIACSPEMKERICLDGSAVMAAYGVRDVADIDFLFAGEVSTAPATNLIGCHNDEAMHYALPIDDLVLDPRNYFWCQGIKFLSLPLLREMKARRGETKDKRDLARIDRITGAGSFQSRLLHLNALIPEFVYSMRHRFILALKRMVPPNLRPLAKRIYDLPITLREMAGPYERTLTYRGFEVFYSKGTSLVKGISRGEIYEHKLSAWVAEKLKRLPEGIVVDVGTNIGLISLNIIHEYPQQKLWCFEPGPHQAELFRKTVVANDLSDQIEFYQLALSDRSGVATFQVYEGRHASGDGFMDTKRAGHTTPCEVNTEKLDKLWDKAGKPDVRLIKLDTEGAELLVLKGAVDLLKSNGPVLVFEMDQRNLKPYPYEAGDLIDFIQDQGYTVFELGGAQVSFDGLEAAMERTSDFVAFPNPGH